MKSHLIRMPSQFDRSFVQLIPGEIIDECEGCEAFSFMDGFSGNNQIQIKPKDQHKLHSFVHGVHFPIVRCLLVSKNVGATFHQAMSFSFHDLKHIVKAYLNDLASQSCKRTDHPTHLRLILERCRYFQIRLNPNK
jgi:hypothetical protein